MNMKRSEMAKMIDMSILAPDATYDEVVHTCNAAKELEVRLVCFSPCHITLGVENLKDSEVEPGGVAGFPFGATTPEIKAQEAKSAIENGAKEIDMVMNISALLSSDYDSVEKDIRAVVEAASNIIVKVILETCLLNDDQKKKACELATRAGARFVKTCTGFTCNSATPEDVKLLKKNIAPRMEVKAAGGIRSYETAVSLIEAGATRLATAEQYVRKILAQCEEG